MQAVLFSSQYILILRIFFYSGASNSLTINNLVPATVYRLRIRASTSLAAGNFTHIVLAKTNDSGTLLRARFCFYILIQYLALVPSEIVPIPATISASEIKVTWRPPAIPNGEILRFEVFVVERRREITLYPVYEVTKLISLFLFVENME